MYCNLINVYECFTLMLSSPVYFPGPNGHAAYVHNGALQSMCLITSSSLHDFN